MNPLIEQFRKYGSMSEQLEEELNRRITFHEGKKHEYFLKEGQTNSSLFVIESGFVRGYFIKNEKEVSTWFGKENELIGSILPLYSGRPSFENIQFLEDTAFYAITSEDLHEVYNLHPEFNVIGRKILEFLCEFLEDRIISFHTDSAEIRYRTLIAKNPDIVQRINLGYIASFLGITQETLSRIRSRF